MAGRAEGADGRVGGTIVSPPAWSACALSLELLSAVDPPICAGISLAGRLGSLSIPLRSDGSPGTSDRTPGVRILWGMCFQDYNPIGLIAAQIKAFAGADRGTVARKRFRREAVAIPPAASSPAQRGIHAAPVFMSSGEAQRHPGLHSPPRLCRGASFHGPGLRRTSPMAKGSPGCGRNAGPPKAGRTGPAPEAHRIVAQRFNTRFSQPRRTSPGGTAHRLCTTRNGPENSSFSVAVIPSAARVQDRG